MPITHFQPDQRFEPSIPKFNASPIIPNVHPDAKELSPRAQEMPSDPSNTIPFIDTEDLDFGGIECPAVPGFEMPIHDYVTLFGRNRGIQGHQNSCYLDATLFAMFSFTR